MKWYLKVLQNYARFEGRARRKEYWMFFLFNMLFVYGLQFLAVVAEMPVFVFASMLYLFGILIPSIAVSIRRMHDVGVSGWYILVPIYSFILAFTEGEKGENKYGPDPKVEKSTVMQEA